MTSWHFLLGYTFKMSAIYGEIANGTLSVYMGADN